MEATLVTLGVLLLNRYIARGSFDEKDSQIEVQEIGVQTDHVAIVVPPQKAVKKMTRARSLEVYKQRTPKCITEVLCEQKLALLRSVEKSQQYADVMCDGIKARKYLDMKAWYCISRPQYKYSCGVSSLTAIWNYLFTTLGHGDLPPVTQEEVLKILGFSGDFSEISFGPFTGNATIIKWFCELSDHFEVKSSARLFWKISGKNKTIGMTEQKAKKELKKGLVDKRTAFIYHCHNHYMVPIGFEESGDAPTAAYTTPSTESTKDGLRTHILIGDSSKANLPIHCVKFEDIAKDLSTASPEFYNIRHTYLGVQTRKTKSKGSNVNCIMIFENLVDQSENKRVSLKERIKKSAGVKKQKSSDDVIVLVPKEKNPDPQNPVQDEEEPDDDDTDADIE